MQEEEEQWAGLAGFAKLKRSFLNIFNNSNNNEKEKVSRNSSVLLFANPGAGKTFLSNKDLLPALLGVSLVVRLTPNAFMSRYSRDAKSISDLCSFFFDADKIFRYVREEGFDGMLKEAEEKQDTKSIGQITAAMKQRQTDPADFLKNVICIIDDVVVGKHKKNENQTAAKNEEEEEEEEGDEKQQDCEGKKKPATTATAASGGLGEKEEGKRRVLLFLDDLECLCCHDNNKQHEQSKFEVAVHDAFILNLKTHLLDTHSSSSSSELIVVGATQNPFIMCSQALSAFTDKLYIPFPDASDRFRLLKDGVLKTGYHNGVKDDELNNFVADGGVTDGMSPADLVCLCKDAAMEPLREIMNEANKPNARGTLPPPEQRFPSINMNQMLFEIKYLVKAGSKIGATVSKNEVAKMEEFAKQFST